MTNCVVIHTSKLILIFCHEKYTMVVLDVDAFYCNGHLLLLLITPGWSSDYKKSSAIKDAFEPQHRL